MNHHSGHPYKRRSVAQRWIFFPTCLVALASLLCTPLIGAGQYTGRNQPLVFHGHHVNVASVEAARWLISEERQDSDEHHVSTLPQPVPIPGGINVPPLIHVFSPGPVGQGFQGFDIEPNVITNFSGFTAQGYPTTLNAAQDNNGNLYDIMTDMRVFQGEYVAADGTHHRGTFVFIWIDLFKPGSGFTVQLHDFFGGIQPSGLFWIVQVPDDALEIEDDTAELNVEHASVLDDFQFLAPSAVPATVSIHMKWTATGAVEHFVPQSSDPTDPTNFAAEFRPAVATGTFSGSELGFSFTGSASSESTFAEMGHERNGVFLNK